MIRQLILELIEKGEPQAAKGLAIAYLKHEDDPEVANSLAKIHHDDKEFDKALVVLNNVKNPSPQIKVNRAKCLYYLRRAPEAEKLIKSLPKQVREDPMTQIDLSLYTTAQGKFDESVRILKPLADKIPQASFNYGWFLMEEDFYKGYEYVRTGANLRVGGHEWLLKLKYNIGEESRWNGETVDTIAYYLEGGMGDEMIFIRYANHFKKYCNTLKIFATPKTKSLFEACGYENVYLTEDIVRTKWNKFVPAMSAPYLLKLDHPCEGVEFPYLKMEAKPVPEMNEVAKGRKKICVRWKGNPEFEHDQFRSIPVEEILKLDKYGQLFSLQMEECDLPKNAPVWDITHLINDWTDTYNIFEESDLIITSCTATAHLAGAMGKRVIVMPPLVAYITWASDKYEWYGDNVTVIKQSQYNKWDDAIKVLHEVLEREIS